MRLPDWQPRLLAFIASSVARPFVYGQHDCALFAAGAVQAMCGVDLAAAWRGHYATRLGGIRALRRAGFRDHIDVAARQFAEVAAAAARVGDLAVVAGDDGPALGLVQGPMIYVLRPGGGLGLVPLASATRIFRV
ncbi:MAG: hypothetical protein Q8O82_08385 [Pseudorhodobacter sp.]|nr:hypothetical protein [Pseudorhodobacter sp.]